MSELQATCLVASPFLEDPNFFRTVILMIAQSDEGAMGLVLNRPTQKKLRDILPKLTNEICVHDDFLFSGGPVHGPLVALHNVPSLAEKEYCPGMFFTTNGRHLKHLSRLSDIQLRIFDGYAGWGPGQLEAEVEQGGWLWATIDSQLATGPVDELWQRMIQIVGRSILSTSIDETRIPDDPNLN